MVSRGGLSAMVPTEMPRAQSDEQPLDMDEIVSCSNTYQTLTHRRQTSASSSDPVPTWDAHRLTACASATSDALQGESPSMEAARLAVGPDDEEGWCWDGALSCSLLALVAARVVMAVVTSTSIEDARVLRVVCAASSGVDLLYLAWAWVACGGLRLRRRKKEPAEPRTPPNSQSPSQPVEVPLRFDASPQQMAHRQTSPGELLLDERKWVPKPKPPPRTSGPSEPPQTPKSANLLEVPGKSRRSAREPPKRAPSRTRRAPNPLLSREMLDVTADMKGIRRIAQRIREPSYTLRQYYDDCVACFPELRLFFTASKTETLVRTFSGFSQELNYQRTMGSFFIVYWLLRLPGDGAMGFCYGAKAGDEWVVAVSPSTTTAVKTKSFEAMTSEERSAAFLAGIDWGLLSSLIDRAGCGPDAGEEGVRRIMALLCLIVVKDLMKETQLQPTVQPEHAPFHKKEGGMRITSSKLALTYMMQHFPHLLPSYAGLDNGQKDLVCFLMGGTHLNLGAFVQAEAPPGPALSRFKKVMQEGASQADIHLYFVYWLSLIASRAGTPLAGAEWLVQRLPLVVAKACLWPMPFICRAAIMQETNLVEKYLQERWSQLTAKPLPAGPTAVAIMRLALMVQDETPENVVNAFEELRPTDQKLLAVEFAITGVADQHFSKHVAHSGPAFLLHHVPGFLQGFAGNWRKIRVGLHVLCVVLRAARELWPLTASSDWETVTITFSQLRGRPLADMLRGIDQCCWVLLYQNSEEGKVTLRKISQLNELCGQGARFRLIDFSDMDRYDIEYEDQQDLPAASIRLVRAESMPTSGLKRSNTNTSIRTNNTPLSVPEPEDLYSPAMSRQMSRTMFASSGSRDSRESSVVTSLSRSPSAIANLGHAKDLDHMPWQDSPRILSFVDMSTECDDECAFLWLLDALNRKPYLTVVEMVMTDSHVRFQWMSHIFMDKLDSGEWRVAHDGNSLIVGKALVRLYLASSAEREPRVIADICAKAPNVQWCIKDGEDGTMKAVREAGTLGGADYMSVPPGKLECIVVSAAIPDVDPKFFQKFTGTRCAYIVGTPGGVNCPMPSWVSLLGALHRQAPVVYLTPQLTRTIRFPRSYVLSNRTWNDHMRHVVWDATLTFMARRPEIPAKYGDWGLLLRLNAANAMFCKDWYRDVANSSVDEAERPESWTQVVQSYVDRNSGEDRAPGAILEELRALGVDVGPAAFGLQDADFPGGKPSSPAARAAVCEVYRKHLYESVFTCVITTQRLIFSNPQNMRKVVDAQGRERLEPICGYVDSKRSLAEIFGADHAINLLNGLPLERLSPAYDVVAYIFADAVLDTETEMDGGLGMILVDADASMGLGLLPEEEQRSSSYPVLMMPGQSVDSLHCAGPFP